MKFRLFIVVANDPLLSLSTSGIGALLGIALFAHALYPPTVNTTSQ